MATVNPSHSLSKYLPGLTGADLLLWLTILFWGLNFSAIKYALAELPPLAFTSIRFVLASGLMLALVYGTGHALKFQRHHLLYLIGLGLLGNTTYQLFFVFGMNQTTAGNSSLILATVPAWVALLGTLTKTEQVEWRGWLGVGLSLGGIALIILGSNRQVELRFGQATILGDLLIFGATLCWSGYTLLSRSMMRHYPALVVTGFSTVVGAVPLVVFALPSLVQLEWSAVSRNAWLALLFSGTFGIGLAYLFWNFGVSRLGSTRTSLYSYLVPPVSLVAAWLWLGETLTLLQGLGAVLALSGVVLARRFTRAVV